jgi:HEAT repeat protein
VSLLSSQTSFHFEWLRRETAASPLDFGALAARAPTSALVGADVKAKLLDNRIAGLDLATLLDTLRRPGAEPQGDARFLWRATGFLEKHPEAASELLALYRSPGANPQLQGRVLDLLASVGHEQAQAAMRAALGDPRALVEGDVAARRLYQRLGLLEEPDLRTAEMVAAHYHALRASGTTDAELTSAYSLGAIVGKLARGDDEARALARSYNAELASDIRGASDPTELAHRVSALGNARLAENVALFSELAQHESARVRRHVAQALGKAETDAPPDALLALMGDPDPVVQRTAVRGATPDDSVYRQLAQDVSAGRVPQLNVRPILDLVKEGRSGHREATSALLSALLAQGIDDDKDRELALLLDDR